MSNGFLKSALVVGLGALVGVVACGSDKDDGDKYPTLASFCSARAKAECTSSVIKNCSLDSVDSCQAKRASVCINSKPSGAEYRPSAAEKCLSPVGKAFVDDKITPEEKQSIEVACASLWGGSQGAGTACQHDYECDLDSKLLCVKKPGNSEGFCNVPREVGPAADCSQPDMVCKVGYYCTPADKTCGELRRKGSECSPTTPCQDGLRCLVEEGSATGTCVDKLGPNSECTVEKEYECASGICSLLLSEYKCLNNLHLSPNEPTCSDFR